MKIEINTAIFPSLCELVYVSVDGENIGTFRESGKVLSVHENVPACAVEDSPTYFHRWLNIGVLIKN